jgi:hypothetical protein
MAEGVRGHAAVVRGLGRAPYSGSGWGTHTDAAVLPDEAAVRRAMVSARRAAASACGPTARCCCGRRPGAPPRSLRRALDRPSPNSVLTVGYRCGMGRDPYFQPGDAVCPVMLKTLFMSSQPV